MLAHLKIHQEESFLFMFRTMKGTRDLGGVPISRPPTTQSTNSRNRNIFRKGEKYIKKKMFLFIFRSMKGTTDPEVFPYPELSQHNQPIRTTGTKY